jgi:hypothetical protein
MNKGLLRARSMFILFASWHSWPFSPNDRHKHADNRVGDVMAGKSVKAAFSPGSAWGGSKLANKATRQMTNTMTMIGIGRQRVFQ